MLEDLDIQDSCHFDGGPRGRRAGAKERGISDAFMVAVASGCRRLRMLKLSSDMISDLSLVALARWSIDLRLLMLKGRSKVTDVGCMALALGCLLLRHISLMTEHVTSQGIAAFSGLNSIWLHRTDHVDLSGLKALMRRSPNLTSVIAENCENLPEPLFYLMRDDLDEFQQSHPTLMKELRLNADQHERGTDIRFFGPLLAG